MKKRAPLTALVLASACLCAHAGNAGNQGGPDGGGAAVHGATVNSIAFAFDMLEVWLLVLSGSRYHICACISAPATGLCPGFGQLGHQRAFRS
jgi:hypothetical protein